MKAIDDKPSPSTPFDPPHADERCDIEWRLLQPEPFDQPFVDNTDARMKQKYPTH
jgi:hypothetical protein